MSNPPLAALDDQNRRFYTWPYPGGNLYWSVTLIIGQGVPKHLVPWAVKLTSELALADVEQYGKRALKVWDKAGRAYVEELRAKGMKLADAGKVPDDFALRWLKGASDRVRDAAAQKGTEVHDAAEAFVLEHGPEDARLILAGGPLPAWPENIRAHLENGFVPWVRRFRPEFIATEASVFNRRQAYAGTLDWIARLEVDDGSFVVLGDYKSGRDVYPEVGLQLSALRRGDFIGLPDGVTELAMPAIDRTAVLHLTPRGYGFRWVRSDDEIFRAFLFAREVFRFREELAPTVLGEDIVPGLEGALAASLASRGVA